MDITIKKVEIEQNFEQLLFLGDIHGEWDVTRAFIKKYDLENICIVQVGDFGIGFKRFEKENRALTSLNLFLKKRNCMLMAIRGNHDCPALFETDYFKCSNIKFLSDYTILSVKINAVQKNIFCFGGAISIDRKIRKQNIDWWLDEGVNCTSDMSILNQIKDIHIIVTHTSPDFVPPFQMGNLVDMYALNDEYLKLELNMERQMLGNMIDYIIKSNHETLTHYFYGHFHRHERYLFREIKFECLAIDQFSSYNF